MKECLKTEDGCKNCLAQCGRLIKAGAPYQQAISYTTRTKCDRFDPNVETFFNNNGELTKVVIDGTVVLERDEVK